MAKVFKLGIKSLALIGISLGLIVGINYFNTGLEIETEYVAREKEVGPVITVMNWNLGYAGLGKDSDFVMDGGENLLPPSREIVEINAGGIADILQTNHADFYFFQEISKPDMLNMGIDVLGRVRRALSSYTSYFTYDFHTVFIPRQWALKHGLATFSTKPFDNISIFRLPNEPDRFGGIIQRQYHAQASELSIDGKDWVMLNIHLSAFDENGNIRIQQFDKLLKIADKYFADGKHVVIGGDWNMQLTPTDFPHTTQEKDLFWLKVLPKERLPANWQLVFDPTVASVRTNYQPYIKGENYTTIIDGFLVSPNVKVLSVKGIDTDFEFTDHQPILAEFTSRQEQAVQ